MTSGGSTDSVKALMPIFFIVAIFLSAALLWCLASTCMGPTIIEFFGDLWEHAVLSAKEFTGLSRPTRLDDEEDLLEMGSGYHRIGRSPFH
ncbi:uncharacterized protein SCHCODRAFT_02175470 [Schizophyllum commune H4-8]|nr:uncharacterized protein SCHCODRAFT_02175470 [Schizophyllum commune H4-8]KAI5898839.1 hypothetical protein SCHCODRAFT_02175470 [Schizophyllum commune H4-8]